MKHFTSYPPSAQSLLHQINRLTRRLQLAYAVRGLGWGLVTGIAALCVMAFISRLVPLWSSTQVQQVAIWFLIGGTLLGGLTGALYLLPFMQRLRLFDNHLMLADRLTTAWEILHGQTVASPQLAQLQVEETILKVQEADIKLAFPLRPGRISVLSACLLLLILIPLLSLPHPQDAILAQRQAEAHFVSQAVEQLTHDRDTLAEEKNLTPEELDAALSILEQALTTLEDAQASLDEKRTALIEAEYQLGQLRPPDFAGISQQIAEGVPISLDPSLPDDSIVQRIRDALTSGDMGAVSAYLSEIVQSESELRLTPAEIQALADVIDKLGAALQGRDPSTASTLSTAAQTMTEGNADTSWDALRQAADTLSSLAQAQQQDAALQEAQAGVQQAQQALRQVIGQGAAADIRQTGSGSGTVQPGSGMDEGTGGGMDSDSTQGVANGGITTDQELERLAAVGGEVTLPRQAAESYPVLVPGVPNASRVPYQDVYAEYAAAAEAVLNRRTYPPRLRDYIRDYFSSLEE